MNRASKLFLLPLLSVLIISSAFGKERTIYLRLDGGKLIVMDGDVSDGVLRRDNISWMIVDSRIDRFQIMPKTIEENNIFTLETPSTPVSTLRREVAYWIRLFGGDWDYSITAWDRDGKSYPIDPKIPVKPIIRIRDTVLLLLTAVASFIAILYRNRWREALKAHQSIR